MYLFLPAGYVGYYILGYYLCKNRLTDKQKNTILVAGIFGAAYAIIGEILYSQYTGEPSQATYNNLTLNIACYAAAVFMIFKDKVSAIQFTEKVKRRIFALGKATLGIYLIHVKISVKVLKTNDTWYGMTYHEDVAAVKDSFKKMLEKGVYKADLFADL